MAVKTRNHAFVEERLDQLPWDDIPFDDDSDAEAEPYDPLDAQSDCFRPPALPTLVHCLHCEQEYESFRIEWRVQTDARGRQYGCWCCPIPGCDGRGFGFDIFPLDDPFDPGDGRPIMSWDDGEDEEGEEAFDDADEGLDLWDDESDGDPPPF